MGTGVRAWDKVAEALSLLTAMHRRV